MYLSSLHIVLNFLYNKFSVPLHLIFNTLQFTISFLGQHIYSI